MPTCAKCNNWVSFYDMVCPSCGHLFGQSNSTYKDIEPPPADGFVYLLQSGKYFKIGKTVSFDRRIKEIKLQLPFDVVEVHVIRTNNIDLCEDHWHRHFNHKRKNGEWFELNETDVNEFIAFQVVTYK